jgi:hypothetical protein
MTQDEIIEMARQAGFIDADWNIRIVLPHLEAFAKLVAQHEREACAEVCKKHADFYAGLEPSPIAQSAWAACVDNRDTIRARGQA